MTDEYFHTTAIEIKCHSDRALLGVLNNSHF